MDMDGDGGRRESDFVANAAEQKVIREPPQICSPDMTLRIEKDSGLSSKNLGNWQAGFHHNAMDIAIRRFTQRLQSDRTLLEKML
jgi:hypothetical protein